MTTHTGRLSTAYVAAGTGAGTMVTPRNVGYDYNDPVPEIVSSPNDIGSGATFADFHQDAAGNVTLRDLEPDIAGGPVFNLIYQTLDAIERKVVTPVTVGIAPPGFLERSLLSVQLDQFVIDLRALPKVGAAREWFSLPRRMREVGALFLDDLFFEARVQTKMFDLIAFVRTTTPAVPTPSGIRGPGK